MYVGAHVSAGVCEMQKEGIRCPGVPDRCKLPEVGIFHH